MSSKVILFLIIDDGKGGASAAAHLIREELYLAGFQTRVFVRQLGLKTHPSNTVGRIIARLLSILLFPLSWKTTYRSLDLGFISNAQLNEAASHADAIWIHWPHDGWISLSQLKRLNKPLIWTVHDYWILQGTSHYRESKPKGLNSFLRLFEFGNLLESFQRRSKIRLLSSMNIRFHCTSLQSLAQVTHVFGVEKTFYWPLSLHPSYYEISSNRNSTSTNNHLRILIGASPYCFWDPRKGMNEVLTGLQSLHKETPITVVVLGIGEKECDQLQRRYHLRLEAAGIVQPQDMPNLYKRCDLLCVGSRDETYCMMIPEALLCGTPVICRRVGIAPQIIQTGINGFLLDDSDSWYSTTTLRHIIQLTQLKRQAVLEASLQAMSYLRSTPFPFNISLSSECECN